MNPWIDFGLWCVVATSLLLLIWEVPRAAERIKKILEEENNAR